MIRQFYKVLWSLHAKNPFLSNALQSIILFFLYSSKIHYFNLRRCVTNLYASTLGGTWHDFSNFGFNQTGR